ncbi:hypothetical protein F1880_000219 [Penicillium rolfsii]|nr:hypothetical protein F1880_000219 [Penicillium rolfsii]
MLSELPEEILRLTSKELEHQHDRLNLAISCRRLYGALHPTIFYKVKLCDYGWGTRDSPSRNLPQVSHLLSTIVRNPQYARMVQELELGSWETEEICDLHGYPGDFDFDRDVVEKLVQEATSDRTRQEKWRRHLELGVTDAWLALLIPRLTNLRKISIVWTGETDYVTNMFVEVAKSKTPVFPHLEEAWAAHWATEDGAETELMLPFFKFPSMRKIGGFMLYDRLDWDDEHGQKEPFKDVDIGCSSVTDIDLRMTNATNGLQTWIRACKALKTLRLGDGGMMVSYEPSHRGKLYEALKSHKTTLQAISISDDSSDGYSDENENTFMGSFADFANMKLLNIPWDTILERDDDGNPTQSLMDVIPSSLEFLSLFDGCAAVFGWLMEQFELLLDSNFCPNLKTICIEVSSFRRPEVTAKEKELTLRCQDRGVAFQVLEWGSEEVTEYWDSVWPCGHVFEHQY